MRKKISKKRELLPDPKYGDQLATRFVNNLMVDGKKSVAYKVFYDALEIVEKRKQQDEEKNALDLWKDDSCLTLRYEAAELVELRSRFLCRSDRTERSRWRSNG